MTSLKITSGGQKIKELSCPHCKGDCWLNQVRPQKSDGTANPNAGKFYLNCCDKSCGGKVYFVDEQGEKVEEDAPVAGVKRPRSAVSGGAVIESVGVKLTRLDNAFESLLKKQDFLTIQSQKNADAIREIRQILEAVQKEDGDQGGDSGASTA